MEDHIRENITLYDLCHDNMIGRSQLQKIFQEQHQCGAMDFFSRLKIAYARQLIRENQMNLRRFRNFWDTLPSITFPDSLKKFPE